MVVVSWLSSEYFLVAISVVVEGWGEVVLVKVDVITIVDSVVQP